MTERLCEVCGTPLAFNQQRACSLKHAGVLRSGAANTRFNGGLCFYGGRWIICCRDRTVMAFARGVMAAALGRLLRSDEIVHHINEDPADDRLGNLQIVTRAEHVNMHRRKLLAAQYGGRWAA